MNLHQHIEKALEWRYAVKRFDPTKKIAEADWKVLADSLIKTPSSYGLQPWKFVVVENQQLREKLKAASWNQAQVTDASHLVVIVAKEKITTEDVHRFMKRTAEVRAMPIETLNGFRDSLLKGVVNGMAAETMIHWNQKQTYIAMGFLLETAALLGVDSCPMEGILIPEYDSLLGFTGTGYTTVAAIPLGYRHAEDKAQNFKKVRYHVEEIMEYRK